MISTVRIREKAGKKAPANRHAAGGITDKVL